MLAFGTVIATIHLLLPSRAFTVAIHSLLPSRAVVVAIHSLCRRALFFAIRALLDRRSLLVAVCALLNGRALINTRRGLLRRRDLIAAIRGGLHWRPYAWTGPGLNVQVFGPDGIIKCRQCADQNCANAENRGEIAHLGPPGSGLSPHLR